MKSSGAPEAAVQSRETVDLIRFALQRLPNRQRQVLTLYLLGYPLAAIADMFEASEVQSNLFHARASLKTALDLADKAE